MSSTIRRLVPFLFPVVFVACASTTPSQLLNARSAYARAAAGGGTNAPGELADARQALEDAEHNYSWMGDDKKTRDLAYLAERKAQYADATGRWRKAYAEKEITEDERAKTMEQLLVKTENDKRTAEEAAMRERAAREAAEVRTRDALRTAAKSVSVKTDERGTVMTLPSNVLFATGKSELLPSARERLGDVAVALKVAGGEHSIVVEGHTDNVGDTAKNEQLSKARAEAVRKFLVSKGVDEAKITAVGKGEEKPIESNRSAQGRAINRRVEVVVEPTQAIGGGPKGEEQPKSEEKK